MALMISSVARSRRSAVRDSSLSSNVNNGPMRTVTRGRFTACNGLCPNTLNPSIPTGSTGVPDETARNAVPGIAFPNSPLLLRVPSGNMPIAPPPCR